MTVPIHNEDSIMRDITQPKGLRIVRTIPLDMDVPASRRNLDECSEQFKSNIAWLQRNLGVRNSEHPEFDKVMKKLKLLRKKIKF